MRPPAKIGVIVESAPQDRKRLFPKKANANEPARKAKNPISGENPPSRAVAICSGIAMAARVRPATRSRVKNRGRYESSERNNGQALFARAKRGSGEPGVFAMKIRRLTGTARAYATGQCLPQTKSDDTNGAIHPELTARLTCASLPW